MKIVSVVLRIAPHEVLAFVELVPAVPGAQVQATDVGAGKVIVTIEDNLPGAGNYAVSDSLVALHQLPQVQGMTIAYEYCDDSLKEV